jgi:hypothetical protein
VVAFVLGSGFFLLADKTMGVVSTPFGRAEGDASPWAIYLGVSMDLLADGIMIPARSLVASSLGFLLAIGQVPADVLARAYISPEREPLPPPDLSPLRAAGIPSQGDDEYPAATASTVRRRQLLAAFLADDGWVGGPSVVRRE